MQKTWKDIFISYMETSKHLRAWAPIYQVFIASKPVINKSKRGVNLLIKYLILLLVKLFWWLAGKPKLKGRPEKRSYVKNKTEYDDFVEVETLDENLTVGQPRMRVEGFYNLQLAWRLRTDLGRILGKNPLNKLVKPPQELA